MPFSVKLKVGHVFSISESSITSYSCFWKWKMAMVLYRSGLWITEKQLMLSSVAQEDAKHFMRRECSTVTWRLQSPKNLVMLSLLFLNREGKWIKYNYRFFYSSRLHKYSDLIDDQYTYRTCTVSTERKRSYGGF